MKEMIAIPSDNDILSGRGNHIYGHLGNQRFRVLIALHLPIYTHPTTTKRDKTLLIHKITEELSHGCCRFLRECMEGWTVLSKRDAREKVGHALRDEAAGMFRYFEEQETLILRQGRVKRRKVLVKPPVIDVFRSQTTSKPKDIA